MTTGIFSKGLEAMLAAELPDRGRFDSSLAYQIGSRLAVEGKELAMPRFPVKPSRSLARNEVKDVLLMLRGYIDVTVSEFKGSLGITPEDGIVKVGYLDRVVGALVMASAYCNAYGESAKASIVRINKTLVRLADMVNPSLLGNLPENKQLGFQELEIPNLPFGDLANVLLRAYVAAGAMGRLVPTANALLQNPGFRAEFTLPVHDDQIIAAFYSAAGKLSDEDASGIVKAMVSSARAEEVSLGAHFNADYKCLADRVFERLKDCPSAYQAVEKAFYAHVEGLPTDVAARLVTPRIALILTP
ncbi:hypothetical protein HYU12_03020 [Candidatus Woesearchaeota archaeon]|nr:hypothetical protein [Candidatus Woesearchaeota archaeon]